MRGSITFAGAEVAVDSVLDRGEVPYGPWRASEVWGILAAVVCVLKLLTSLRFSVEKSLAEAWASRQTGSNHGLVLAWLRAGLVRDCSSNRGHSRRKPKHENAVQTLYGEGTEATGSLKKTCNNGIAAGHVHERTENHVGDKGMGEVQEGCVYAWELTGKAMQGIVRTGLTCWAFKLLGWLVGPSSTQQKWALGLN